MKTGFKKVEREKMVDQIAVGADFGTWRESLIKEKNDDQQSSPRCSDHGTESNKEKSAADRDYNTPMRPGGRRSGAGHGRHLPFVVSGRAESREEENACRSWRGPARGPIDVIAHLRWHSPIGSREI